jgi:hypothetical protein
MASELLVSSRQKRGDEAMENGSDEASRGLKKDSAPRPEKTAGQARGLSRHLGQPVKGRGPVGRGSESPRSSEPNLADGPANFRPCKDIGGARRQRRAADALEHLIGQFRYRDGACIALEGPSARWLEEMDRVAGSARAVFAASAALHYF